jgi:hypothetical protein
MSEETAGSILRTTYHFHGKCTDLLHAADGFTSPPKEDMLRIFVARKIRRLQPDLNPRTWVPEASMLTTRPLKMLGTTSTLTTCLTNGEQVLKHLWQVLV